MTQPRHHGSGAWGRWVLLGTAITQATTPAFSSFTSDTGVELVVVPPGPFFAIWAVIIAGCLASAIWGLPRARATTGPYARIQVPLTLAQVGFSAWLLAAGASPGWTVPIFLLMLTALAWSLRQIVITPTEKVTRVLLGTTVGLYTGWSAAAVWLNAATVLPATITSHPAVLTLVLLGAVGTVLTGVVVFHAQAGFVAAGSWALLVVAISTAATAPYGLSVAAAAGLALIATVTTLVRRRHHQQATKTCGAQ